MYIQLTLWFLIGWKCTLNFQNQHLGCHLAADYTIVMSRTLKVAGSQVMNDHGAWFPRVIFSSLWASCCLLICIFFNEFRNKWWISPIVGTISFFIFCIIKQLLDSVFVISRIIKVLVRVISLQMIILDITKTSSSNYLISSLDFGLGVLGDSQKLKKI